MKNYIVFDVGDALYSMYIGENSSKSVFDFGSSPQKLVGNDYLFAKTFVISHFHEDHYVNFTLCNDNSLTIDNLIIPKLPNDPVIQDSMKAFMTIQLYYLGKITGYFESDLLNLIRQKNQNDFSVIRVCKDETFTASQHDFKVLWPDINYLSRLKSISNALKKFKDVTSKNDLFRKFHDQVKDSNFWKSDYVRLSEIKNGIKIKLTSDEEEEIRSVNDSLKRLANDICLAFDREAEILFLGDLSDRALDELFKQYFKTKIHYDVILSAHHGTHSSIEKNWRNVTACAVVTSGGRQMVRKFRGAYYCWSKNQHHTYCKEEFRALRYIRICKLLKIWKFK